MIDITKSQVITYGSNQSVTVYQDHDDSNTYYIVPTPVIPEISGVPAFALVKYTSSTDVSGVCSFQTEVEVPADALAAVKAKLGSGITIGQFDWQNADTWFTYTSGGASHTVIASPSLQGSLRASFIIQLPDETTLNTFINAFGPNGSAAGTFQLEYKLATRAQMADATVVVEFNSNIAYEYQKTVSVTKNVWGSVTSRKVTIHEYLSQSQSGTITVNTGGSTDPTLKQALTTWGTQTLQNDVTMAVDAAIAIIGENNADNFTMNSVASFTNKYVEDQYIDWFINPQALLPAYDTATWAKVYSEVANQTLDVAFTVANLNIAGVDNVLLTVRYAGAPQDETHTFTVGGPGSWNYHSPGDTSGGSFNGQYQYKYTVNYHDTSHQAYNSAWISSTDTNIYFDANSLSVLSVPFDASGAFTGPGSSAGVSVSSIDVNFFFLNQNNGKNIVQHNFTLTPANSSYTVYSNLMLPSGNPYQYSYVMHLSNGSSYTAEAQNSTAASGTGTDNRVVISSPFQERTVSVFVIQPSGGSSSGGNSSSIEQLQMLATYSDTINNINEQHQWAWQKSSSSAFPEAWSFIAPANVNGQRVTYQGQYVDSGGTIHTIQSATINNLVIDVSTTQQNFSVTIDPSQIQWTAKKITQVVVNLYTKDGKNKTNIKTVTFTSKMNETDDGLYTFFFDTGTTATAYYTVQYWHQGDTDPGTIGKTTLSGTQRLTLPGDQVGPGSGN